MVEKTEKPDEGSKRGKKARGEREWTPEHRARQAEYMRKIHAQRKQAKEASSQKSVAISELSLGMLMDMLSQLQQAGASDDTPIHFFPTCSEGAEIAYETKFDNTGKRVGVINIR